jgi:hypothetical protein
MIRLGRGFSFQPAAIAVTTYKAAIDLLTSEHNCTGHESNAVPMHVNI